jgi:hypothetical protein
MSAVQLDEDFFNEVGMKDLDESEKKYFVQYALEILQLRIGTRLSDDLTDAQIDELEKKMVIEEHDTPEIAQRKQQAVAQWLEENHPNYRQVVEEETEKFKHDMKTDAAGVLNSNS